jgi:hypothetical protein
MILRISAAFVAKGTLDSRFKATVIGQVKQLVPPIAFYFLRRIKRCYAVSPGLAGAKSRTLSRSLFSPAHWSSSRL